MSIDDRIFTGWRLPFMPHSEQTGHALSRELIEKEQRFGLTAQVAWAYADAFPALVHAPSPERVPNLHPLHCSKGLLRAAIIHHDARDEDAILALPALDYVQTSSPQVCRLMAGRVRTFHVDNRDALETLKHHHQGISHVYAWQIDPAEDDQRSPFSITHIPRASPHQYTPQLPTWYAPTRHSEELIPLCKFDLDVWLCWSLYERRACLIEGRSRRLSRVNAGPADVVPARASRPWMTPHQLDTFAGRGWAATARYTDQRTERLIDATTERRWLLLSCFERTTYNDDLIQTWRARRPLDAIPDAPDFAQATMASISLDEKSIEYSWIGTHRVLRLRDNTLTQLTEDHDLLYHARQKGQTLDEAQRAQYAQLENIVVKVIPRHAPDSGTCDLRPGDRFILLEKVAQNILAQHLQGHLSLEKFFSMGSPHDVAQRALNILDRALPHNSYIVLIVDSDAQVLEDPDKYKRLQATQLAQAQPPTRSPTVRDLVESPAEYDGCTFWPSSWNTMEGNNCSEW